MGIVHNFKIQAIGTNVKAKAWKGGEQEPDWQYFAQNDTTEGYAFIYAGADIGKGEGRILGRFTSITATNTNTGQQIITADAFGVWDGDQFLDQDNLDSHRWLWFQTEVNQEIHAAFEIEDWVHGAGAKIGVGIRHCPSATKDDFNGLVFCINDEGYNLAYPFQTNDDYYYSLSDTINASLPLFTVSNQPARVYNSVPGLVDTSGGSTVLGYHVYEREYIPLFVQAGYPNNYRAMLGQRDSTPGTATPGMFVYEREMIPLYLGGTDARYLTNQITLYTRANQSSNSELPLFTSGSIKITSQIPLYTKAAVSNSIPLFLQGSDQNIAIAKMNLFVKVNDLPNTAYSNNLPLFLEASSTQKAIKAIPLFLKNDFTSHINLFLCAEPHSPVTASLNLFLANIPPYISNSIPLFVDGAGAIASIPLFLMGEVENRFRQGTLNLFGQFPVRDFIPLMAQGKMHKKIGGVFLYTKGVNTSSGNLPLVMPNVAGTVADNLRLYTHGF